MAILKAIVRFKNKTGLYPVYIRFTQVKHVAYSLLFPFSGVLAEHFTFGECVIPTALSEASCGDGAFSVLPQPCF